MIDLLDDPNAGIVVMRHFLRNIQAYGSALPRPDFTTLGSSEFEGSSRRAGGGRCRRSTRKGAGLDLFRI